MTDPGTQPAPAQVRTFLFVHVIWSTKGRQPLLKRTLRKVLGAHMLKMSEAAGISVLAAEGHDDHLHLLVRLHAVQNLLQVVRQLQSGSADWLRGTQMAPADFAWEEGFMAYSVSPSALKQVQDFLDNQEQYHQGKTLEQELELFEKASQGILKP
jgi:putative transposase